MSELSIAKVAVRSVPKVSETRRNEGSNTTRTQRGRLTVHSKTPKNPKRPRAISNDRTSLMPKGKCSVLLYHIYTEAHRTVIPIRAKSMWKGWYPLPDRTISNLRRYLSCLRTIVAFHFQQSCGNVHQCTEQLRYQNQKETFVSVPERLHPSFKSSRRYWRS